MPSTAPTASQQSSGATIVTAGNFRDWAMVKKGAAVAAPHSPAEHHRVLLLTPPPPSIRTRRRLGLPPGAGTRGRKPPSSRNNPGLKHRRKLLASVTGQPTCSVTRLSSRCGKIRGFATPPRSGCAISADVVWSGAILPSRRHSATTAVTITGDSSLAGA
jgi:hypothetical protein